MDDELQYTKVLILDDLGKACPSLIRQQYLSS